MKTLLISVFDSNMVRNILRTDVLSTLAQDASFGKIILLVHPLKLEEYRKEFGSDTILLDSYPSNLPSKAELFTWFLVRHSIHTKNVRAKIDELYYNAGGGWLMRLAKHLVARAIFEMTLIPVIDRMVRALTKMAHPGTVFDAILDRYKPDLVFLPTIFATNDVRLLTRCKKRSIPTIGMIKSWDNLIGKDPLLVWPDRLIVHNDLVKDYAVSMHRYPEDRIFVSGVPQMDIYADPSFPFSREEFFRTLGLDPEKKLIVYAAVGKLISFHEFDTIRMLADLVVSNKLECPSQLLVRLHPAYPSDEAKLGALPGVTIVRPGTEGMERNPLRFDFEFRHDETRDLATTMDVADVVIQSGSTMAIDAACFDTPIISLGLDGYQEDEKQERSARRLLVKDHFKRILDTGGAPAVYTHKELVTLLNLYLADPSLDHEGRMRIVREQCFKLDGKSGKRIAHYISSFARLLPGSSTGTTERASIHI